jgi:hypothetical protein
VLCLRIACCCAAALRRAESVSHAQQQETLPWRTE